MTELGLANQLARQSCGHKGSHQKFDQNNMYEKRDNE
jgi:hypothetical protein